MRSGSVHKAGNVHIWLAVIEITPGHEPFTSTMAYGERSVHNDKSLESPRFLLRKRQAQDSTPILNYKSNLLEIEESDEMQKGISMEFVGINAVFGWFVAPAEPKEIRCNNTTGDWFVLGRMG
jgi:hypothetical protein